MDAVQSQHERALDLARAGRHAEALGQLREHLLDNPLDGEALNDAGALLYALGRYDQAARHLRLAADHLPGRSARALANLAEVHLARGRAGEAMALFEALGGAGALTADLVSRTAAAMVRAGRRADAVDALLRSMRLAPQVQALAPLLAEVRKLRPKVALVGGAAGLYEFVRSRFDTRVLRGGRADDLEALLRWCDVAWFTACGPEAAAAGRLPKSCRTAVCVDAGQIDAAAFDEIDWSGVDLAVARGSRNVRDVLARRLPQLNRSGRLAHLRPAVDVAGLPFACRRRGPNLACIDGLEPSANPALLLACFRRLREADDRFRLFFAGYCHDDRVRRYLLHRVEALDLGGSVFFDGWQEDLPKWLSDKHYVVSAGIAEDHAGGVLTAAAMGLAPVVHAFPGARELLGESALFDTPEAFCRRVLDEAHDPAACRRRVRERFGMKRFLHDVDALLRRLERLGAFPADEAPAWQPGTVE